MLRGLGLVCVALGIVGAFVPLLPTTCFLIAAVYCFAAAAPAWRQRILDHPRFGPPVRDFVENGTLSRRAKTISIAGIAANAALTLLLIDMHSAAVATLLVCLSGVAVYIGSRPEPVGVRA